MPFLLRSGTKDDCHQCGTVQHSSYIPDPLASALMPQLSADEQAAFFAKSLVRDFDFPSVRLFVVEDTDTGKVVAFSQWRYPSPPNSQLELQKEPEEEIGIDTLPFPEGSNTALLQAMFAVFKRLGEKYYDSEKMYLLEYLAVHPAHQRRGLGHLLLSHGLQDADTAHAPTFLSASDAGLNLYLKCGFKVLEEVTLDFVHLGMSRPRNTRAMIRPAGWEQKPSTVDI